MKLSVAFSESNQRIDADFSEVHVVSDGGFDRGFAEGYAEGHAEGYAEGHAEGYAEGEAAGLIVADEKKAVLRGFVERTKTELTEKDFDGITKIGAYAFYNNDKLLSATIPETIANIGSFAFAECKNLVNINMSRCKSSGERVLYHCAALSGELSLVGLSVINANFCNGCVSLEKVVFGKRLSQLKTYAFGSCKGMKEYDFTACESVPTLAATNVFNNIPADCIMKIPSALFDEWKTATNWSAFVAHMVAV